MCVLLCQCQLTWVCYCISVTVSDKQCLLPPPIQRCRTRAPSLGPPAPAHPAVQDESPVSRASCARPSSGAGREPRLSGLLCPPIQQCRTRAPSLGPPAPAHPAVQDESPVSRASCARPSSGAGRKPRLSGLLRPPIQRCRTRAPSLRPPAPRPSSGAGREPRLSGLLRPPIQRCRTRAPSLGPPAPAHPAMQDESPVSRASCPRPSGGQPPPLQQRSKLCANKLLHHCL